MADFFESMAELWRNCGGIVAERVEAAGPILFEGMAEILAPLIKPRHKTLGL